MSEIIKEVIELPNGVKGTAYSNLQGMQPDCWLIQLEGIKNCNDCPSRNKIGSCGGGLSMLGKIYSEVGGLSQFAVYHMQKLITSQNITFPVAIRKMNENPNFDGLCKNQLNTAWRKYLEKTDPNPKEQQYKVLSGMLDLEYGGNWYTIDDEVIKIVHLEGLDGLRGMLDDVDDETEFILSVEEGFYTVDDLIQYGESAASCCATDETIAFVSSENFNEEWIKDNLDSQVVLDLADSIFNYGAGRVTAIDEKFSHDDEQEAIDRLKDEYGIELND